MSQVYQRFFFGKHKSINEEYEKKAEAHEGIPKYTPQLEAEVKQLIQSSKPISLNEISYFKEKGITFRDVIGEGTYGKVWLATKKK